MGRPIELTILGPIQSTHRAHDVCFVRVLHCEPAVVFWCEYTFAGQTNLGLCWEKVHPRSLSQLGGSAGRRKGIPLVRLSSTSCAKWRQWKAWRTCGSRGDQVAGVCRQRSNAKQNWSRFRRAMPGCDPFRFTKRVLCLGAGAGRPTLHDRPPGTSIFLSFTMG